MKGARYSWWVLGAVLLVVAVFVVPFLYAVHVQSLVKGEVRAFGADVLGVPLSVRRVRYHILQGVLILDDVKVGNPKGFSAPLFMTADHIRLKPASRFMLSSSTSMTTVEVEGVHLTYEIEGLKSNMDEVLNLMDARLDHVPSSGLLRVGRLHIGEGRVTLEGRSLEGYVLKSPLPSVTLHAEHTTWLSFGEAVLTRVNSSALSVIARTTLQNQDSPVSEKVRRILETLLSGE